MQDVEFLRAGRGGLHRMQEVMGIPILIDVCDEDVDERAIDRAYQWLRYIDATFSTYRPDSEISRLNRGELRLEDASREVQYVARRCEQLRSRTHGYFDMRAPYAAGGHGPAAGRGGPGSIDPSGFVKGWSLLGAGELLERAGVRNYAINAGGDLLLRGRPPGHEGWRTGIQHPRLRDQVAMVLVASDVGVATSGAYERGDHILDPHTGTSPDAVLSVTVIGPNLAEADAYATAAFAMGRSGAEWCAGLAGYAAIVIGADGRVLTTEGIDRYRD